MDHFFYPSLEQESDSGSKRPSAPAVASAFLYPQPSSFGKGLFAKGKNKMRENEESPDDSSQLVFLTDAGWQTWARFASENYADVKVSKGNTVGNTDNE